MGKMRVFATPPAKKVTTAIGQFDFPAQLVGTSKWTGSYGGHVNVYYDPATGANGLNAAQFALARIDDLMAYCDTVFGVRGQAGNIIIAAINGATNGTSGAYHYGCSFGPGQSGGSDWYEDVSPDPLETFGLVMAEVSESYMGLQGKGWNCGGSGGEGLSRYLAEIVSGGPNGSLGAFSSGPSWDGTDWISRDQGTDQDYPSIGCAVLYLWWMTRQGFTPAQIIQAGEPDGTLASNYLALTSKTTAFADFKAAVQAVGGPGGFQGDNPFGALTPPYPFPGPTPPPPPPTGNLLTLTSTVPAGDYPLPVGTLHVVTAIPPGQYDIVPHGQPVPPPTPPPTPPPVPIPTALFSLTFPRPVRQGARVLFRAPVAIPAGTYSVVAGVISHADVEID